jgi:hypothetical protein
MMRLLGQMIKLPIAAFVYGMELLVKVMKDIQKTADQGVDMMVNGIAQGFSGAPDGQSDSTIDAMVSGADRAADHTPGGRGGITHGARTGGIVADDAKITHKEVRKMADTNLNDDMLKLVRYKIMFVKRDYEHAFPEVEELVWDNTTPTAYTGWKIAEFVQKLESTEVPSKWGGGDPKKKPEYPEDAKLVNNKWMINKLEEEDKKYLRVFYEVLDRYVREPFKYEEEQIDVLKEIRDEIRGKHGAGASTGSGSGGTGGGGTAGGGVGGGTAGGGRGSASP